jgi:hypothetical protein
LIGDIETSEDAELSAAASPTNPASAIASLIRANAASAASATSPLVSPRNANASLATSGRVSSIPTPLDVSVPLYLKTRKGGGQQQTSGEHPRERKGGKGPLSLSLALSLSLCLFFS